MWGPLELGRECEARRSVLEGAAPLIVPHVQDPVEERNVGGIDAAFERLEIVALLPELRDESLGLRHQGRGFGTEARLGLLTLAFDKYCTNEVASAQ